MKTIKTQAEAEALIKDGKIIVDDDLTIECDVKVNADIIAHNIDARNIYNIDADDITAHNIDADDIKAHDIDAHNIYALNIDANDIDALNIDALDIDAYNIIACDIYARNIKARNIEARNIDANNISFYAVCVAYQTLTCKSITGRREGSIYRCLDSEPKIGDKQ